jgi:hypothetical protein
MTIEPRQVEEPWQALGHKSLLADSLWPPAEDTMLVDDTVTVAVQLNGKPPSWRGRNGKTPSDRGAEPDRQRGGAIPAKPKRFINGS